MRLVIIIATGALITLSGFSVEQWSTYLWDRILILQKKPHANDDSCRADLNPSFSPNSIRLSL